MTNVRLSKRSLVLATSLFATTAAGSALASPGAAEDRLLSTPVEWGADGSKSITDVDALGGEGFRLTDLEVTNISPLTFSTVCVKNVGVYDTTWGWFHGETLDVVRGFKANGWRPTVVRAYYNGSDVHFAGAYVNNSGTDSRNTYVLYGSADEVFSAMPSGYRPVTISSTVDGNGDRVYAVLATENLENYGWYWYYGVTADQIQSFSLKGSRATGSILVDANADNNDAMLLNVIYYVVPSDPFADPWFSPSVASIRSNAGSAGDRAIFLASWTLHGTGTADGDTQWLTTFVDN